MEQTIPQLPREQWIKENFQQAGRYLSSKGHVFEKVILKDSRYLHPVFGVWLFSTLKGERYWVITGEFPSDLVKDNGFKEAKEVMRHFTLSWQLKAEGLDPKEKIQKEFRNQLIISAEALYSFYEKEELWPK